jgi:exonuclease SbcD
VKILHASDLHLDSPLRGLERYESAPVERIRGATRRALENLVSYCLEESVELLLIAGDLFDGSWRDYAPGLFLSHQLSRLREANVSVVWLRGNHDAESRVQRYLKLPDNVRELLASEPQTIELAALNVAVHGQGFARPDVTEDLASNYPRPVPGALNLGLLHTALDGRPGHDPYAPASLATLVAKGYQYWALGHVHKREVLQEEPWVVFSGNLQGRFAREHGAKGATLVEADGTRIERATHVPLDVVRWEICRIGAEKASGFDDVLELLRAGLESALGRAEDRLLAVRVQIEGTTSAHGALQANLERLVEQARAIADDVGGGEVWVEKVELHTHGGQKLWAEDSEMILGQLEAARASMLAREGDADELFALLEPLQKRLGELGSELGCGQADGAHARRKLLEEAYDLLSARLGEGVGG